MALFCRVGGSVRLATTLKLFWSIVEHNQDRARQGHLRACRMEPDQEFDVWADEPLPPEPPDDAAIPSEPAGI